MEKTRYCLIFVDSNADIICLQEYNTATNKNT